MPHITVDHSPRLAGTFDQGAFAAALHAIVLEGSGSRGTCKTFFRTAAQTYVGGCAPDDVPMAHVEVALLPGRSEATTARLSGQILALLREHLGPGVVCSVEVRPLAAYSLYPTRHAEPVDAALSAPPPRDRVA
ncbi:5-carboxymethyl-2-hydroxymuconate delta isomerase [Streptomyces sp. NPDC052225]|uniref:5-carboxymethyl-2-hydroxymuconate Delta-isomerase n=1 Tax=Streptomyces sp. NPDC052225 TaxID=3154949 RepID=UPI003444C284